MPQPIAPRSVAPRRWRIATLLAAGVLVNYLDRVNLSVSEAALHVEFGITQVSFGYLLGAYSWTYAALQMPMGALLDRFGARSVGRVSTCLWSFASFAAALATGTYTLIAARLLLGLSIGFASYNYAFYLLLTWLPSYLSFSMHIDLLHSVLYTGVPWLVAAGADLFIGGWYVDWLVRRGHDSSRVRRTVLLTGTALGTGIVGAAYAQGTAAALAWITLAITGLSAAAPIATGYIAAATGSFQRAFAVAGCFILVGLASYLALGRSA